jgi:uncharacterized protein (TIGR02246 family)
MIRPLVLVLAVAYLGFADERPADDAAIKSLVKNYLDAREHNDPKGVEALFTADADQLVSSGEWRRGRPDVVKGTLASSQSNSGRRTIDIETIRYVTPNTAIADGKYQLGVRQMWSTFVMVKQSGGWRIAAIRNMLPAAPAR